MRILSGIQPSGRLHLGNYFGMMRPAIELQNQGEAFYFIANYHALTTVFEAKALKNQTFEVALDFLAAGLDPEKAVLFRQSDVPEVTELAWILSTLTPMGLLERCHSYKDKLARGIQPSHGLFAYPVLMAADILIYDSDVVPVGKDQKQHVEVARDIAIKFNERFGVTFKLPEPRIQSEVATVLGVDGQKMSKSYNNGIFLSDEEKIFRKKVMGIKTDSTPMEQPKPIEDSIILQLYALVASQTEIDTMKESFQKGGVGYGEYKKQLFEALWNSLASYREKRTDLLTDPQKVEKILQEGAEKARHVAQPMLRKIRKAVGLC
ncbi:MAG: tryptophan--tRNA ligase [Verrucomicrobiae bacterium]|nr:tryptophan--tRNA ligase [Verrucomicrobiae bacterium]